MSAAAESIASLPTRLRSKYGVASRPCNDNKNTELNYVDDYWEKEEEKREHEDTFDVTRSGKAKKETFFMSNKV